MSAQHHPHHLTRSMRIVIVVISMIATLSIVGVIGSVITSTYESTRIVTVTPPESSDFQLPENTGNVLKPLSSADALMVARNQPAVVRILTVYCADVTLSSSAASFTVDNACSGGVGSGSFISSDGYIATNGHVVTVTPKRALVASLSENDKVSDYLTFMVKSNLLSAAEALSLATDMQSGSSDATRRLSETIDLINTRTVTAKNITTQYAVQLGIEPVRVDRSDSRVKVVLSDQVVSATLAGQDFDVESSETNTATGEFRASDVALLKVKGSFPYISLGTIDDVYEGDTLTAIGYPAFVDGSVDTTQWQTVPSITQGEVQHIQADANVGGRMILVTSVPLAQGNSGGPALSRSGLQIGINTYSDIQCADLNCFGDGIVRDIADLKALIADQGITLKKGGVTDDWNRALDAYVAGDYVVALALFEKVQSEYPSHYLAAPYAKDARSHISVSVDAGIFSPTNVVFIVTTMLTIISIIVISFAVFTAIYFTHRHHTIRRMTRAKHRSQTP